MIYKVLSILCLFTTIFADDPPRYFLSVCTIFKDEAPYLKEWIEYNKLMGVQHFRLYNNESTDNYLKVLQPYIQSGEVTVTNWPGGHGDWVFRVQKTAIADAIAHLSGVSKWLAIIDIDEFIVPMADPDVATFLQNYDNYSGVIINWQNFGTSWVQDIPPGKLLIEVLTLKAGEQTHWNQQVKSIVKPECVDTSKEKWTPHLWCYFDGCQAVTPSKTSYVQGVVDVSKIRINHYVHRTEKYLFTKKLPRRAITEHMPTQKKIMEWHEECNEVKDKAIFRFIPALRKRVFPTRVLRTGSAARFYQ